MAKKAKSAAKSNQTAPYKHPEAKSLMRPEVGTQAQFKKKPFEASEHKQIAVKVIDDRGNELLVVKKLT